MSQPLQTVTAKVHFQIKDMIVNECARLGMTESGFLNYYLDKSIRQANDLHDYQKKNQQLTSLLEKEKATNESIKLSDRNKTSNRKQVEQILEANEGILAALYTQHGNKPVAAMLLKEAGFKTSYFTEYQTVSGEKMTIYWQYDYGFKNLGNNQLLIVKR